MRTITLEEILNKYKEILEGKITREQAELFADELIKDEDDYVLLFLPKEDKEIIWDELLFLAGIGLQDREPQNDIKSYFHNEEDIQEQIKKIEDYKKNNI